MSTLAPASALVGTLDAKRVPYEVIQHRRTQSAAAEARAIGVEPEHVAKTLILTTDEEFVRAILPADERLDLHKVRELLGRNVRLATERELTGAYPEFELGAVPPVGGAGQDRVLVDEHLRGAGVIAFEAGTHELSVQMEVEDLVLVADASYADICA